MCNKKELERIEAKLDLLLTELGHGDKIKQINKSIGGGGIKNPPPVGEGG